MGSNFILFFFFHSYTTLFLLFVWRKTFLTVHLGLEEKNSHQFILLGYKTSWLPHEFENGIGQAVIWSLLHSEDSKEHWEILSGSWTMGDLL